MDVVNMCGSGLERIAVHKHKSKNSTGWRD